MVRKKDRGGDTPRPHGVNGSGDGISIIPLEAGEETGTKVDLDGQVALIVGGATGNGRSLAVALAGRGVDVVLVYFNSAHQLALTIKEEVEARQRRFLLIPGEAVDGSVDKAFARDVIAQTIDSFGRLDIFINYSANAFPLGRLVTREEGADDMRSRIFPHFNLMRAALDELIR